MNKRLLSQATACVATVCAFTSQAKAGTGEYSLVDASGLEYFVNADINFDTTSSASGAASEASYTASLAVTTVSGGEVQAELDDMFDGARSLWVSPTGVTTAPETGSADMVAYNKNGAAALSCSDREIVFPVQTIGDLEVSRRVFVPSDDEFIRHLEIIKNTGSEQVTVTIGTANNLGSDGNTKIDTTSDADTDIETSDTWITTFQNFSGATSSDPRIGHVLRGNGTLGAVLTTVTFTDLDDNPYWWWTLTLNPGETQILASFATGQPSKAAAREKAAELADGTNAHMFDCVSPEDRVLLVNFPVSCTGATAGTACNDYDRCTLSDVCTDGVCGGSAKDCRDGADDCTGVCDADTGECLDEVVEDGTECADADLCNGAESCQAGTCTNLGAALECDDADPCTADSCDAAEGCGHDLVAGCKACEAAADCDDGDPCNGSETCGSDNTCQPGTAIQCGTQDPSDGDSAGGNNAGADNGDSSGSGADAGADVGGGSSGSADTIDTDDESDSKGSSGCAAVPQGQSSPSGLWFMLGALGLVLRARRRR